MAFAAQTFTFEEILASAKLNQTDENIDQVRAHHKGNAAPPDLAAGIMWLDDTTSPWDLQIYDGADFISIGKVDPTGNQFLTGSYNLVNSKATTSGSEVVWEEVQVEAEIASFIILIEDVGLSGAAQRLQIQLSTGSVYKTTGYVGSMARLEDAVAVAIFNSTSLFELLESESASFDHSGIVQFNRLPATDIWFMSSVVRGQGPIVQTGAGYVNLGGSLDGVKLKVSAGTLDAGQASLIITG